MAFIRLLILPLLSISALLSGQNLVPNNGFESATGTPTGYGQWYKVDTWSNVNEYPAFLWPYASPDYLHITGSGGADLPVSTFGTVTPYAGNVVMGFITWLSGTPQFREYLSIPLLSPLVPGVTYTVSFWITNGTAGWYNGYSSNHIGAQFTVGPMAQADHEPIGGTPQCEYAGELWSTSWQYVSFSYVPDMAYDQITIGNFYNDVSTSHTFHVASISAGSYYFIDEVVVEPATPLPLELIAFSGQQVDADIRLEWETAAEMGTDRFEVQKLFPDAGFLTIGILEAAGFAVEGQTYALADDQPWPGENIYRLRMIDINGTAANAEAISVTYTNLGDPEPTTFPNPSSGDFRIQGILPGEITGLEVYDMRGVRMRSESFVSEDGSIPIDSWPSGAYLVIIYSNDHVYKRIHVIQ